MGRYEDAEARLANAFRAQPGALAEDFARSDTENAERAQRFVRGLEASAPVNLDALQALCTSLQAAAAEDGSTSLSADEFLQASSPVPVLYLGVKGLWYGRDDGEHTERAALIGLHAMVAATECSLLLGASARLLTSLRFCLPETTDYKPRAPCTDHLCRPMREVPALGTSSILSGYKF